ncbi:MAG: hypothetical protein AB2708_08915 [Candidatus Thiodiazotropha taylori]
MAVGLPRVGFDRSAVLRLFATFALAILPLPLFAMFFFLLQSLLFFAFLLLLLPSQSFLILPCLSFKRFNPLPDLGIDTLVLAVLIGYR